MKIKAVPQAKVEAVCLVPKNKIEKGESKMKTIILIVAVFILGYSLARFKTLAQLATVINDTVSRNSDRVEFVVENENQIISFVTDDSRDLDRKEFNSFKHNAEEMILGNEVTDITLTSGKVRVKVKGNIHD